MPSITATTEGPWELASTESPSIPLSHPFDEGVLAIGWRVLWKLIPRAGLS
jgi:hypothetical protein